MYELKPLPLSQNRPLFTVVLVFLGLFILPCIKFTFLGKKGGNVQLDGWFPPLVGFPEKKKKVKYTTSTATNELSALFEGTCLCASCPSLNLLHVSALESTSKSPFSNRHHVARKVDTIKDSDQGITENLDQTQCMMASGQSSCTSHRKKTNQKGYQAWLISTWGKKPKCQIDNPTFSCLNIRKTSPSYSDHL